MKRSIITSLALALSLAGCEEDVAAEEQFQCESLEDEDGLVFCADFNDGSADGWRSEGGSWSVVDGRYLGSGPMTLEGAECGATLMTASLRDGSESTDLRMHAQLGSLARVDKTLVLRATDASNRIELNFRGDPLNDLIVQELVDCEAVYLTDEGEVANPRTDDRIDVEVLLQGKRLVVEIGGETVLDREFDFANTAEGRAGVAVIDNAMTTFDDVWMRRL